MSPDASEFRTIRLRGSALWFKVRGAMDVWSIKETFLDRFYEKYGFAIQPDWKIVDIGAGIGDYALYAAVSQPSTQVFAFEPFPPSFALMQENLRLNRVTNVQVSEYAIAATSGELILDLSGGEPLQFQSHARKARHIEKSLSVQALSLADAFAMLRVESCDLLKLDCEGAEYAILFGAPSSVLETVQRVVVEYHDDFVQYNHRDLCHFLSERGFRVETFPNPVYSSFGYLRATRNH